MQLIDSVYDDLKERIFQAEFKLNRMITEREVCEHYNVSRVTAGEALHRLCHEGHLTAYPRTGYMVTALSPVDMAQIKRMRLRLESLVIDILCAEAEDGEIASLDGFILRDPSAVNPSAANRRFHMEMARLSHDPYLISALESLIGAASRVEQAVDPVYLSTWQDYHRGIVDALMLRNADLARENLAQDLDQR